MKISQNLKCENENSEMDIEGTVIKVELKPPLPEIEKLLNVGIENAKQDDHNVKIKSGNQGQNKQSHNALSIEETIDIKLGNEEIRSYTSRKRLNTA